MNMKFLFKHIVRYRGYYIPSWVDLTNLTTRFLLVSRHLSTHVIDVSTPPIIIDQGGLESAYVGFPTLKDAEQALHTYILKKKDDLEFNKFKFIKWVS